jgi:hypothetical protein
MFASRVYPFIRTWRLLVFTCLSAYFLNSYRNDGDGASPVADVGHVRVFAWGGPVLGWVKLGSDINGDEEYGYFGKAVALSGDGTTVAVGAEGVGRAGDHATDDYFGEVRMLRWSGTNWVQLGSRIRGDVPDDYFGSRLVLSNNGNTVAIGAQHRVTHTNDHPDNNRGYVKVFDFTSGVWVQRGSTLWG